MPNVSDGTACPVRRWFNNMPPVRHLPRPLATRRPAHNSINAFRKRFLGELGDLFTQILLRAYGLGVLRLGDVSLDGTKIHANASKHKALSWGYANRLEEQLREEVDELLKKAGAPAATASAVIRMRHRLKTADGKAVYARRKVHGGTSVWHHQTGDGVPPVPVAWIEGRNGGMDAGLHRLQFEAAPSAGGITLPKGKGKPH